MVMQAKKRYVVDKRMEDAIEEVSKVPYIGFYVQVPEKLKREFDSVLGKSGVSQKDWLLGKIKELTNSAS